MIFRLWRSILAAGLLTGVLTVPGQRLVRAASCGGPLNVVALASGADPRATLLAGTRDNGLYQSADGGRCWTRIGSYPPGFSVGTTLVPPHHPGVLIAGGSFITSSTQRSASLYRSDDAGKTWRPGTAGLPHTLILPEQLCSSGLARSTDAGRSWQQVGPKLGYVKGVVALGDGIFVAAAVPFVGQHSTLSLLQSSDDGRTWHVLGSLPHHDPQDLATLFAVPWSRHQLVAGWGIMFFLGSVSQSVDGGAHWPRHVAVKGVPLAFAGMSATHTLLLSALSLVYRSTDGGHTWAPVLGSAMNSELQSWAVLAAPNGRTAYVGTAQGVYRSTDDGRTWRLTTK